MKNVLTLIVASAIALSGTAFAQDKMEKMDHKMDKKPMMGMESHKMKGHMMSHMKKSHMAKSHMMKSHMAKKGEMKMEKKDSMMKKGGK